MNELLQKLLEAELLSEDTKTELETAAQTMLDEAIEAARTEESAAVRAELTEQWVTERDALIEAIDAQVTEFLEGELNELKEDIESFRDIEAEYAERLVEEKSNMSAELRTNLTDLVEKIDAFLEIRLTNELDELREDIEETRKNEFGRKIYEAFEKEFASAYADEESAEVSLRETEQRLSDVAAALEESERKRADLERSIKMEKVLSPLSGRQKEVMEAILRNVDTDALEEGYKTFIGRVIRETDKDSEKESGVLAEGAEDEDEDDDEDEDEKESKKSKKNKDDKDSDKIKEGAIVTGDTEQVIVEDADEAELQRRAYLKKLAGI